jgi:hypothetical protein
MLWEVLPHPAYSPDLVPSDSHLFSQLKESLGRGRFRLTMKLNFLCNNGWMSNHKLFLNAARTAATVYRGAGKNRCYFLERKFLLINFIKASVLYMNWHRI